MALAVVICRPDDGFVLVEVEADQEAARPAHEPGDLGEQASGGLGVEVADGRTREKGDPPRAGRTGIGQREPCREVGVDWNHTEFWKYQSERAGRCEKMVARDV